MCVIKKEWIGGCLPDYELDAQVQCMEFIHLTLLWIMRLRKLTIFVFHSRLLMLLYENKKCSFILLILLLERVLLRGVTLTTSHSFRMH